MQEPDVRLAVQMEGRQCMTLFQYQEHILDVPLLSYWTVSVIILF